MTLFLTKEREVLQKYFPDFDSYLTSFSFTDREEKTYLLLNKFKELNGPSLMIPKELGGLGASIIESFYIQRAIASRSPSLAIACTMHHFSIASLIEVVEYQENLKKVLQLVVEKNLLLSSSFAEGTTNSTFSPLVSAKDEGDLFLISGSKKPCTLSRSMDILTGSVRLPDGQLGIFTVPSNSKGIFVKDFWNHWILKGSETEEIVLDNVEVAKENIFIAGFEEELHPAIINGLIWFELIVSSSYIGVGSSIVEKVIHNKNISNEKVQELVSIIEGAMSAIEGLAYKFKSGHFQEYLLPEIIFVRKSVEDAVKSTATKGAKLLGGIQFLKNIEISYLLLVCQLLHFHPPSKKEVLEILDTYLGRASHLQV